MRKYAKTSAFLASLIAGSIGTAHAALSTEVTGAMTAAKTDTLELAGLAFVVVLGIVVFKWFRRAL